MFDPLVDLFDRQQLAAVAPMPGLCPAPATGGPLDGRGLGADRVGRGGQVAVRGVGAGPFFQFGDAVLGAASKRLLALQFALQRADTTDQHAIALPQQGVVLLQLLDPLPQLGTAWAVGVTPLIHT